MTEVYRSGTLIGNRYEVVQGPQEKPSLAGGMGIVYLCEDLKEDRPVALKTFKPEYLPNRAARDRFLREGTHWVDLGAHPHIVHCYQVIQPGVAPEVYLVLELVAKEQDREDASLRSWLPPGHPLPVETALLFALQIARGMAHAAAVIPGFVHRDLKPENVLVGADRLAGTGVNRLRVTDFGLAAVLEVSGQGAETSDQDIPPSSPGSQVADPLRRTQLTRGIVGTPSYMAPEQWRGEGMSVAADVYALGCMLYEMVAGQRAVSGGSLAALERAHCMGQVQPLPGSIPGVVREMVQHCMAVEPVGRYGTWEKVEAALAGAYAKVVRRAVPKMQPAQKLNRAERVAVGWSYAAIGSSYLDIGKAKRALGYFERAREVGRAKREGLLERSGLNGLGEAYRSLGNMQQAICYHEQALTLSRKAGDQNGERGALSGLGIVYKTLGDVQQAIRCHERALEIAREVGNWLGEGDALANLGIAYRTLGDAWRAIEYYEQALTIWREIGDRHREGSDLGNLGNAYADLGDAQHAIDYYEQALAIAREIGDRRNEGAWLGGLGIVYANMGYLQKAIELYKQTLVIWREIGNRHGEGVHLCNLGTAYDRLGDVQQAMECYQQAWTIQREVGDIKGAALDLLNIALLYARQNELAQALPLAQQAAELSAGIGYTQCAERAQQLVTQLRVRMR